MPTNQKRGGISIGFFPNNPATGFLGRAINSATNALALGWSPDAPKTLSKVRAYQSGSLHGTLAAGDLVCTIYGDNGSGTGPDTGSSLGSTTTVSGAASNSWMEFSGLSIALTAGRQYWAVLTNPNTTTGDPTTNYPTVSHGSNGSAPIWPNSGGGSGTPTYGWLVSWGPSGTFGANLANCAWGRVGYSDGSYDGLPVQSSSAAPSSYRAYLARELGVVFTLPANATFNLRRASMFVAKAGSPASDLVFRLYSGSSTTPLATSNAIPQANAKSGSLQYFNAYFASDVRVAGGTTLRLTAALATNSAGDGTSNYYTCPDVYTLDSDANSLALVPFGAQLTYLNSTWDDSQTNLLVPFDVGLDTDGQFAATGGGVRVPRNRCLGG